MEKIGSVGADFISRFLGWKESRIGYSLERLHLIADDRIDREALDSLPTERAARNFVNSVKELNDATMIKIMANENMETWTALPRVIDETVRVTKQFLEEHPEEKRLCPHGRTDQPVGKQIIAEFLNWNESRVSFSLERLKMINDDTIDKEVIDSFPTERAARNFISNVKEFDIPKEKQKAVADRYKETGSGERAMRNAVIEEVIIPKKKKESIDTSRTIENEIRAVDTLTSELQDKLLRLTTLYREVGGVPDYWDQINWHMKLVNNLNKTVNLIDSFILTNKKQ